MVEAADIREWRDHAVVDPDGHKIGVLEAIYRRHEHRPPSVRHRQDRDAGMPGGTGAIYKHYSLPCQAGTSGERQLARR